MSDKYNHLCNDINQLQESMNILHYLVKTQGETVSTIEDFIQESKETITLSSCELEEANTYNNYVTYIAGGILSVILYMII